MPHRVRDDFAEMTEGLLSNTALEALSAIRTNTHRILRRFNRGIDAPYVAHRAMMEPPEDAREHPVPLIASEIEGVLADDPKIQELVGLGAITEWVNHIVLRNEVVQSYLGMAKERFKEELLVLLRDGLKRAKPQPDHLKWKELMERLQRYDRGAASIITQVLAAREDEVGAALDMEFARLTSLRSQYDAPPPTLKLGSIVSSTDSGNLRYLLCIQPLCDSVRLERPRHFPFLRLKERSEGREIPFDFVVPDGENHKKLSLVVRLTTLLLLIWTQTQAQRPKGRAYQGRLGVQTKRKWFAYSMARRS